MTKRKLIIGLIGINALLIAVIVAVYLIISSFLNNNSAVENRSVNVSGNAQNDLDKVVLGISSYDADQIIYQRQDNLVKVYNLDTTRKLQEIYSFELKNSDIPVEQQFAWFEDNKFVLQNNSGGAQVISIVSGTRERKDLYRSTRNLNGVGIVNGKIVFLEQSGTSSTGYEYRLQIVDEDGTVTQASAFGSNENLYFKGSYQDKYYLASVQTGLCYQLAAVITTAAGCPAAQETLDKFTAKYYSLTRTKIDGGAELPESYSIESYPAADFPVLGQVDYLYLKNTFNLVLNSLGISAAQASGIIAQLGDALRLQTFIYVSAQDYTLVPQILTPELDLFIEESRSSNSRFLLLLYTTPATTTSSALYRTEKIKLPLAQDAKIISGNLVVVTNKDAGYSADTLYNVDLSTLNIRQISLPTCNSRTVQCEVGYIASKQ